MVAVGDDGWRGGCCVMAVETWLVQNKDRTEKRLSQCVAAPMNHINSLYTMGLGLTTHELRDISPTGPEWWFANFHSHNT